ncbi:MAG: hypothetical protein IJB96_04365 [Lachnospira sp.]|nr:hypothetical protein [Lachnospira sp.]
MENVLDYSAVNREHVALFSKRDSRGLGMAFMIVALVFHGIEISCMSAVYGIHVDLKYSVVLLCVSMLMFHRCQSEVTEYGKKNNYFNKFLYVPFNGRTMLLVKCKDILKHNLLYGLVAEIVGFTWRAGVNFWFVSLIDQRVVGLWDWCVSFFDYTFRDYICFWGVILFATALCIGWVYYDYRKALKEG